MLFLLTSKQEQMLSEFYILGTYEKYHHETDLIFIRTICQPLDSLDQGYRNLEQF